MYIIVMIVRLSVNATLSVTLEHVCIIFMSACLHAMRDKYETHGCI